MQAVNKTTQPFTATHEPKDIALKKQFDENFQEITTLYTQLYQDRYDPNIENEINHSMAAGEWYNSLNRFYKRLDFKDNTVMRINFLIESWVEALDDKQCNPLRKFGPLLKAYKNKIPVQPHHHVLAPNVKDEMIDFLSSKDEQRIIVCDAGDSIDDTFHLYALCLLKKNDQVKIIILDSFNFICKKEATISTYNIGEHYSMIVETLQSYQETNNGNAKQIELMMLRNTVQYSSEGCIEFIFNMVNKLESIDSLYDELNDNKSYVHFSPKEEGIYKDVSFEAKKPDKALAEGLLVTASNVIPNITLKYLEKIALLRQIYKDKQDNMSSSRCAKTERLLTQSFYCFDAEEVYGEDVIKFRFGNARLLRNRAKSSIEALGLFFDEKLKLQPNDVNSYSQQFLRLKRELRANYKL